MRGGLPQRLMLIGKSLPPRLRGRGRRRVPEGDEEAPEEEEEKEPASQPPPSDDTRVENMDISDEGEGTPAG